MALCVERNGVRHEYTLLEKLGNGSYSQVYKCKRVVEGKEELFVFRVLFHFMQAVKIFNKSFLKNEKRWRRVSGGMECSSAFEKVEKEIALMKKLSHPNLVKLIDVIDDERSDRYFLFTAMSRQIIYGN